MFKNTSIRRKILLFGVINGILMLVFLLSVIFLFRRVQAQMTTQIEQRGLLTDDIVQLSGMLTDFSERVSSDATGSARDRDLGIANELIQQAREQSNLFQLHLQDYLGLTLAEAVGAGYTDAFDNLIESYEAFKDAPEAERTENGRQIGNEASVTLEQLFRVEGFFERHALDENRAFSGGIARAFLVLLLAALLVVFMLILASLILGRTIRSRVGRLVSSIKDVEGKSSLSMIQIGEHDELNDVEGVFNRLILKLKQSYGELETRVDAKTEVLEEKVQENTKLNQRNEDVRKALLNVLEDQMQSVHDLNSQKKRLDVIFQNMSDGSALLDRERRVIFANASFLQMLDMERDAVAGKRWGEITNFNSFESDLDITQDVQKMIRGARDGQLQAFLVLKRGKKSREVPVDLRFSPIRSGEEVQGMVVNMRDITLQYEQGKAKSEFISIASHQLRTPISAIKWFIELLRTGDAGNFDESQRGFLEDAYSSAQRMSVLVNGLLNVSRLEAKRIGVEPEPFLIDELIQDVLKEAEALNQRKRHTITWENASGLKQITSDRALCFEVLSNLVSNAIKYTPEKGKISVTVAGKKPNRVQFMVQDNGYGIPKDQQEKIFTKFFRADNITRIDTDGSGLGLYIVKKTVELLGGVISFKSTLNKGTTFIVDLPEKNTQVTVGEKKLAKSNG